MKQIDDQTLIEQTITDLRDGLRKLEEEREMLDYDISEKQARLAVWEAKLAELTGEPPPEARKRAPRGANLKAILALLQDPATPRQGMTTSEIVSKTKLSFSSVQVALKQGVDSGVLEQVDSFWRVRSTSPGDSPAARNGSMGQ